MNINEQISRMNEIMRVTEGRVDDNTLNEGWRQWLVAGLLSLATLGGVKYYFLNPNSDDNIKKEYIQTVKPKIEQMNQNDLLELVKQIMGDEQIDWNDKAVQHHYMARIVDVLQKNPEYFAVGENGKVILKKSAFGDYKAQRTLNLMHGGSNQTTQNR